MKLLIFGDIFGKVGRRMLAKHLPILREKYSPDVVIANSENISHGRGPRMNQLAWLDGQGVDIFTGGNHSLDSREDIRAFMDSPNSKQLRPANLIGENLPGVGERVFTFSKTPQLKSDFSPPLSGGQEKILVINVLGTTFMSDKSPATNPYQAVDAILAKYDLSTLDGVFVDFHKETTSEGYAMANYLDGRVSVLWGTHTHIQTADAEIWPKGMGFINDLGFAGARRSIIGVQWELAKHRFVENRQEGLLSPDEDGDGVLSGMYVEVVDRKCVKMEPFRILE